MRLYIIEFVSNYSCHMRFGFIADDSFGVLDFMADIIFIELFKTPPDKFLINY